MKSMRQSKCRVGDQKVERTGLEFVRRGSDIWSPDSFEAFRAEPVSDGFAFKELG